LCKEDGKRPEVKKNDCLGQRVLQVADEEGLCKKKKRLWALKTRSGMNAFLWQKAKTNEKIGGFWGVCQMEGENENNQSS